MLLLTKAIDDFIRASNAKKRTLKNGKPIGKMSINNYHNLKKLVRLFETRTSQTVVISPLSRKNARVYSAEMNYWKRFHKNFADFLFDELDHYDNYVGAQFKLLRSLFKWLSIEKGLNLGEFYALFPTYKEEIQITVLSPSQLKFLIDDKDFEHQLPRRLHNTKDILVFGCTVALRISDLMNLRRTNIIVENGQKYLYVQSKKTSTYTKILLPAYCLEILNKHRSRSQFLLPRISNSNLNKYIKELCYYAGWNEPRVKTRTKRGIPLVVYRNKAKREHFRFCDHMCTHTMRRTAITTMLRFGMDEWNVRRISGHSHGSKEFYRYVKLSQDIIDTQSKMVHQKLQNFA